MPVTVNQIKKKKEKPVDKPNEHIHVPPPLAGSVAPLVGSTTPMAGSAALLARSMLRQRRPGPAHSAREGEDQATPRAPHHTRGGDPRCHAPEEEEIRAASTPRRPFLWVMMWHLVLSCDIEKTLVYVLYCMEHALDEEFLLWASCAKFSIGELVARVGSFTPKTGNRIEPSYRCIHCLVSVSHFGRINHCWFSLCTLSHCERQSVVAWALLWFNHQFQKGQHL
jgi:hypothetical protein